MQVLKLSELLRSLENAGEIGISIGLHSIEESVVKGTKPCCFLLDPPKEKTLQKKVRLGFEMSICDVEMSNLGFGEGPPIIKKTYHHIKLWFYKWHPDVRLIC